MQVTLFPVHKKKQPLSSEALIDQMGSIRHDWTLDETAKLFNLPFNDLLFHAHQTHRAHFDPNEIQTSTLLSIKTGKCPENCAYCPQSAHHNTSLKSEPLMPTDQIVEAAKRAKEKGATRFCMGAAWRELNARNLPQMTEIIRSIKALELETCMTLGMLSDDQAKALKEAGLDYYNHNIDTSPDFYEKIITTRTFDDRIKTLAQVQAAGLKVCAGGILGMGEDDSQRQSMLIALSNLERHPESVPINQLIPIPGTPLENAPPVDPIDFIKTIALARIMMPESMIRLSAGRENMNESTQALCFFAGANSIFYGDCLLTANNQAPNLDDQMLIKLGLYQQKLPQTSAQIN